MKEKYPDNLDGNMTFEDALKKLEGDVLSLEGGGVGLEEAIKIYEDGIKYSNYLMKKLESAEKRVEELTIKSEKASNRQDDEQAKSVPQFSVKPLGVD